MSKISRLYHQPLIHQLPVELLCEVFEYCIPPPKLSLDTIWSTPDNFDPGKSAPPRQFTLGSVSQLWRQVIWTRPFFWVDLSIDLRADTPLSRCRLVKKWLHRTGELPLKIVLQVRLNPGTSLEEMNDKLIPKMVSIISEYFHRCTYLYVDIPSTFLSDLYCLHGKTLLLKGLILESRAEPGYTGDADWKHSGRFDVVGLPQPELLSISGYFSENVKIDFTNLSKFVGQFMRTDECLEILRQAPGLSECIFRSISGDGNTLDPVTHHSLEAIVLEGEVLEMLDSVTLPKLDWLTLTEEGSSVSSTGIIELIQRSGCSLRAVTLMHTSRNNDTDDENILALLSLTPTLTDLSLLRAAGETFFNRLVDTTSWPEDDDDVLLPHLELFSYTGFRKFPWRYAHELAPLLSPSLNMDHRNLRSIELHLRDEDDEALESGFDTMTEGDLSKILRVRESGVALQIKDLDGNDLVNIWRSQFGYPDCDV